MDRGSKNGLIGAVQYALEQTLVLVIKASDMGHHQQKLYMFIVYHRIVLNCDISTFRGLIVCGHS